MRYLGVAPFLAYVGVFLLWPTAVVVGGALSDARGRPALDNVRALGSGQYLQALRSSLVLSASTALIGAVLGAVLAVAVLGGRPDGALRRVVTAGCGVLAQFGGVTLAFAFVATVGAQGLLTTLLHADVSGSWIYGTYGLVAVYCYFQVPLMVLVFLPALEGLRPQWREAAASLGGSRWAYVRWVAAPVLAPAFLGALLLLFANAFSAYATAAALVSQGSTILPLQIRRLQTSEVVLGQQGQAKALGLLMVLVVAVVMAAYALLQRRTSRWLR